ncbi:MAG TPA: hypothetical protein VHS55_07355 [Solirubrobacteraceae bacterium]|jgi:hypothetical protein|nr:hypothetical protein [Solirubrobacteraceae bacterium]
METTMQEELIEHELPPRPRRRLFSPLPIALLCVLLTACGFIGGVLVEKGQGSSTSSSSAGGAGGFASRLAALRSGAAGATGSARGASAGGGAASLFAGGGATIGQVAYTSGHTLYVTDSEGNTVKVTTSAASTVTKTVKSDVKAIHPGETVIVTGSASASGAVKADSIRVSEASAGGALGALFGGGGGGGHGSREAGGGASGGGGTGGGEGPVLFGK